MKGIARTGTQISSILGIILALTIVVLSEWRKQKKFYFGILLEVD